MSETKAYEPWRPGDTTRLDDAIREVLTPRGYTFEWRHRNGTSSVEVQGYGTAAAAARAVSIAALRFGYKPPRWWEYWRWGERPLPDPTALKEPTS